MVNNKLQVVSAGLRLISAADTLLTRPESRQEAKPDRAVDSKESHRLISAFWQIDDAGKRKWLLAKAEQMARR